MSALSPKSTPGTRSAAAAKNFSGEAIVLTPEERALAVPLPYREAALQNQDAKEKK